MDDNLFDPNYIDTKGRTNVQRMEQGLAPIGTDGKSINIRHIDQTNDGPVMEITATEHQQNYSRYTLTQGKHLLKLIEASLTLGGSRIGNGEAVI